MGRVPIPQATGEGLWSNAGPSSTPIIMASVDHLGLGNQSPSVFYTGVRTEKSSLLHKVGGYKPGAPIAGPAVAKSHASPRGMPT